MFFILYVFREIDKNYCRIYIQGGIHEKDF